MTNLDKEKEHFIKIWEGMGHSGQCHSKEAWNKKAPGWVSEITDDSNIRKERSEKRIGATALYLRSKGLLGPKDDVIDIGCGPGRFVAEFAKTCRSVTGCDISDMMLKYGEEYAASLGLKNTSFTEVDFKKLDIREQNWEKAFDLCYSSITPALNTWEAVEKMEKLSRKHCFSAVFVRAEDELQEEMKKELFPGREIKNGRDGRNFYAMFNLLWLKGRYPEISYYDEDEEELMPADEALLDRLLARMPEDVEKERNRILRYVKEKADADGKVLYRSFRRYGWMLWDVRDEADRSVMFAGD